MNGAELEPEEVPELWTRIALRRVLGGRVRCLLGGAGDRLVEITPTGQALFDELGHSHAGKELFAELSGGDQT